MTVMVAQLTERGQHHAGGRDRRGDVLAQA
jgi:hypothetical protein